MSTSVVGSDSSKTVKGTLQLTKIKSRETPKQGITVVMPTTTQSICSHKSSNMCEVASKTRKILDLSKTCLTGVLYMPGERNSNTEKSIVCSVLTNCYRCRH